MRNEGNLSRKLSVARKSQSVVSVASTYASSDWKKVAWFCEMLASVRVRSLVKLHSQLPGQDCVDLLTALEIEFAISPENPQDLE